MIWNWYQPNRLIDWLIDWSLFFVSLVNLSFTCRSQYWWWRAVKFRPMLGAHGLGAGKDLYRATPAVTQGLGFTGLIRRSVPFSHLLRNAWGCWGPILTRIPTDLNEIGSDTHRGCRNVYSPGFCTRVWIHHVFTELKQFT
jgi:hypothetical protein